MIPLELPKIDGHCHVLDPERFPFPDDVPYKPSGQEIGGTRYFMNVMDVYGVRHALLVGPNSGYGTDNRCLLDAIALGAGRFKGIAVVPATCSTDELKTLRQKGVIGIAFNPSFHGLDYYRDIGPLLGRLADLGLWAQFQVEGDQLAKLLPMLRRLPLRVMIDHCGRPQLADGPEAPGVRALLELAETGRAVVKLSGFAKFSRVGYPFDDAQDHVMRMYRAFGPERSIWASDWPFLRAAYRLDYGTVLAATQRWFTSDQCRAMMWDAPAALFGW